MKICLVEDDLALGRTLQALLQDDGHDVIWVRRAGDARYWTSEQSFDAVLLDLGLPDGDGLALLRDLRQADGKQSILVITARDSIEDRLNGLDSGADDYLIKPFAGSELLARLRAVTRRASPPPGSAEEPGQHEWRLKDLKLDEHSMVLTRAAERINLSRTEFAILLALLKLPDRVITRRQLETKALTQTDGRSLDVHIFNLRRKIGEGYIRTVRGVGFLVERS